MGLPRDLSELSDASDDVSSQGRMEERKTPIMEQTEHAVLNAKLGVAERGQETSSGWDPALHKADDGVLDENDNVDVSRKVERLELAVLEEGEAEKKDDMKNDSKVLAPAPKGEPANSKNMKDGNGINEVSPKSFADSMDTGEERAGEEGAEEEEEEEDLEMTLEERKEMREAVVDGDIDLLEDLLEKPNADIRMIYFDENLLMAALRVEQLEMAEFLLDNGVDQNFTAVFVEPGNIHGNGKGKKTMEFYKYSCRQMAYDKDYMDIVEIIDHLNGDLFPGVKLRERVPRLRRPPPTPVSSSSCGDSTSDSDATSSGEESDVSGEAGPDKRFMKPRELKGGGAADGEAEPAARGARGSVDNADSEAQRERRKKKRRRRKKKQNEKHPDDDVQGGDRRHRHRSSEAFLSGGDDTGTEEPSAKFLSGKTAGRLLSTDLGSEGGFHESAASSSRRSGGEGKGGRTGELLTDRSRSTAKSSEARSGDTSTVVNDEGYETMSPSPTHCPPQQQPRFQPPSIPMKPTKAFLALRRTLEVHRERCIPARFNEARPLHWTKVRTPGSYEVESPLWHQPLPSPSPSSLSLSTKLPPPTPAGTATTPSMLSPRSRIEPRTPSQASNLTMTVSTVDLTSRGTAAGGDLVTKPKILTPTQRLSASSQSKASGVASLHNSDVRSAAAVTTTSTTMSKGPAAVGADADNDRMYPLKHRVPSYMRMTTSCFVKRRLEPNFTNSYSSLDFVEPSPRVPVAATAATAAADSYGVGAVKTSGGDVTLIVPSSGTGTTTRSPAPESAVSARKTSHSSRISDEVIIPASAAGSNKRLVARKPASFSLSVGRDGNGFPAVPDVSSTSRRKPLAMAGCGGDVVVIRRQPRDSVPSIRNNSSVFQPPPRLGAMPRKVRYPTT